MCKTKALRENDHTAHGEHPPRSFQAAKGTTERITLPESKFVDIFHLFLQAFGHEVGNGIQCLKYISEKSPEDLTRTRISLLRLDHCFHKLSAIARMLGAPVYAPEGTLTPEETDMLKSEQKFSAAQEIGLKTIQQYRDSLLFGLSMATPLIPLVDQPHRKIVQAKISILTYLVPLMLDHLEELLKNGDFEPKLSSVPVTLPEGKHDLSGLFRKAAYENSCSESGELDGVPPVSVDIYLSTLIVQNVFSNASRAMYSVNTPFKQVEVSADVKVGEGKVIFRFQDHGCGMPSEVMEKLNCGVRATTKEDAEQEHGIGFWYCAKLADAMGGKLYVERSEPGAGTTIAWEVKLAA